MHGRTTCDAQNPQLFDPVGSSLGHEPGRAVPETGFAVAVCTNADRGGALHAELVRWALDRVLDVRATDPQASDIDADAAAEYTGVYEARLARSELTWVDGEIEVRTTPQNLPIAADIAPEAPPLEWARLGGRIARRVAL